MLVSKQFATLFSIKDDNCRPHEADYKFSSPSAAPPESIMRVYACIKALTGRDSFMIVKKHVAILRRPPKDEQDDLLSAAVGTEPILSDGCVGL